MKRALLGLVPVIVLGGALAACGGDDSGGGSSGSVAPEVEAGRDLAQDRGCPSCHSSNGDRGTGPTWKGLYGRTETVLIGGPKSTDEQQQVVDDEYIIESIRKPHVKLVKAKKANVMSPFDEKQIPGKEAGPDKDRIRGIIEFIKSLK